MAYHHADTLSTRKRIEVSLAVLASVLSVLGLVVECYRSTAP